MPYFQGHGQSTGFVADWSRVSAYLNLHLDDLRIVAIVIPTLFRQGRRPARPRKSVLPTCGYVCMPTTHLFQINQQHFPVLNYPSRFFEFDLVREIPGENQRMALKSTAQVLLRDRHDHIPRSDRKIHLYRHSKL